MAKKLIPKQKTIDSEERFKSLLYRTIKKGYYEVHAITDFDKIAVEGFVCGGILKELIRKTIQDSGKVERVTYKIVDNETQDELKYLRAENKKFREKLRTIKRVVKNV